MISGVDRQVGRILQALEEAARAGNTVVIFTSEHGVCLGARGLSGKWFGHAPSIRIPMVIHDPRLPESQRGTRRDWMALPHDLAPTLTDLAGARIAESVQGRSLLPLMREETPEDWRTAFFYEHHFTASRFKQDARIPRSEGVRIERYKYLRYPDSDPLYEELYDLKEDPDESENLADDDRHAGLLKRMRKKWRGWRERAE